MALTARQQRFYIYTIDIWRKDGSNVDFSPYAKIATGVPCYLESSPDDAQPSPLGRTRHDLFVTLDRFHTELGVDIQDTDYVQLTGGPAGENSNGWWAIRGNIQSHGFRANSQIVIGQQGGKPVGAP